MGGNLFSLDNMQFPESERIAKSPSAAIIANARANILVIHAYKSPSRRKGLIAICDEITPLASPGTSQMRTPGPKWTREGFFLTARLIIALSCGWPVCLAGCCVFLVYCKHNLLGD